jgi:hypothetical protein
VPHSAWLSQTDERFSLALTKNLRKDGEPDPGIFDQSGHHSYPHMCKYTCALA